MARRRREAAPEAPAGTDAGTQVDTAEPQATLTVRGSADAVKKQLGVGTSEEKKPEPEKTNGNGHDDEKKKFVESLRNSKYIIKVKRMTPREFQGQKTNVEVWSAELPLSYQEIQDEVTKECGGGKYRVAIVDPNSNNTIAADTFMVDGDPSLPEDVMTSEEQAKLFMQGGPKAAADITEEGLDRRARVSAKLLEVESIESQLEEARARRSGGKGNAQDDARIAALERQAVEARHQREIERRDQEHREEMRQLREMIAALQKPQKSEGQSDTAAILAQMQRAQDAAADQARRAQEASDRRFEALQKQMQDDKLNAVLDEVKSIKNRPQPQNNMLEMAETMLKLNKMISGVRDDDDDDDDGDDKNDDRPWWERALDKLGGKLGDKLFEKFTAMEEKGEKIDREKFIKEMEGFAQAQADQAIAKMAVNRLPAPVPPAPTAKIPPPPIPPPPGAAAPAPVTALPPPPPPAPAAETSEVPAVQPVAQQKLTLEQEIVIRVGGVLEMIDREMELRPNEYHWTYEGCFNSLPESILEKVCAAADPISMIDAFAIPMISPEGLAAVKAKIAANPRMQAWLAAGLSELKEWFAQKLKDPKFDPFADEEGGEEEGQ